MKKRRSCWKGVVFAAFLAAAIPTFAAAQGDRSGLVEQGEHIFREKCAACHSVGQGDRPTGPDLAGVTERRDPEWVLRMIRHPGEVLDSGDPAATELLKKFKGLRMPDLGISEKDAEALVAFLQTPHEEKHAEKEVPSAPAEAAGNAERGRALYTGARPFEQGGAPCLACHGMAGLGPAGGASLGVDLTGIYEDYGADGVASILETLPFPTMEPIFAKRPLTPSERADLLAFFAEISGGEPVHVAGTLALETVGGVIVLLLLAAFVWRGRLRTVRRSLVDKATREDKVK